MNLVSLTGAAPGQRPIPAVFWAEHCPIALLSWHENHAILLEKFNYFNFIS